jgi:hypothetical protein
VAEIAGWMLYAFLSMGGGKELHKTQIPGDVLHSDICFAVICLCLKEMNINIQCGVRNRKRIFFEKGAQFELNRSLPNYLAFAIVRWGCIMILFFSPFVTVKWGCIIILLLVRLLPSNGSI